MHIAVAGEHTHDSPVRVAKRDMAAKIEPGELPLRTAPDHQFMQPGFEPASFGEVNFGAQRASLKSDPAQRDVGVSAAVTHWATHDQHGLRRANGPSVGFVADARSVEYRHHGVARQRARHFRVRSAAQDDRAIVVPRMLHGISKPSHHREHGHDDAHHAGYAQHNDERTPESGWQRFEIQGRYGQCLFHHDQRPARASTRLSRATRRPGSMVVTSASRKA